ncbi:lipopolysaccharide biosynthesis protein [Roseivivax sp. CAU 1753]
MRSKNALIYLVAAGLNAAVPFFTLPFLTRALTPADFGVIAAYVTLSTVAATFIRIELNTVVKKLYSQTPELLTRMFGATLTYSVALVVIVAFFVALLYLTEAELAQVSPGLWACILIVATSRLPTLTLHNFWHVTRNVIPYVSWSLMALGTTHLLTLALALSILPDWRSRVFVDIFVALASMFVTFLIMHRKHDVVPIWDKPMFHRMLEIAAPIWPGALIITLLFSLDRIVLLNFVSKDDLGIYSVAVQFAAVITLLFAALSPPFEAWAYQNFTADRCNVRRIFLKRFSLVAAVSYGTACIAGPILMWFLPYWVSPEFEASSSLILPLMLALTTFGLYRMMNICLICLDRLIVSSALSGLTLAVTTITLVILVQRYGIQGAAYGLLLGFSVATVSQFVLILNVLSRSQKR